MEDIFPYIDQETWVLFDIDDTLMESELQVGRSAWFYSEFDRLVEKGMDPLQAVHKIDQEWFQFVEHFPIRTPEKETASLVEKAKQSAGGVFALTARKPDSALFTFKQMEKLGIDLASHFPKSLGTDRSIGLYENGILFVDLKHSKGAALRLFLNLTEKKPKTIVFIDDLKRHLIDVEKELVSLGIDFVGVHYRKTEERPFDRIQAEQEYQKLKENL